MHCLINTPLSQSQSQPVTHHSGLQRVGKADGGAGGGSLPAPIAAAPSKDAASSSLSLSTEENMELQLQTAKKLRSVSSPLAPLG